MGEPTFDARFDPRFQRGYDGGSDVSAATPAASVTDAPTRSTPARAMPVPPPPTAELATDSAAEPDSASAAPQPADPVAEPTDSSEGGRVRFLLWVAFGLCALAVVGSTASLWSGYTDPAFFSGLSRRTAWDDLRWVAAVTLLDIGMLAAAVVGIWLGMRQATGPDHERLLRVPAFLGLVIGVGVAAIAVLWIGSGPSQSIAWTGDPARMDAAGRAELALAQLQSTLGGPVLRAGFAALLGIVLIAARAAMGRRRPTP